MPKSTKSDAVRARLALDGLIEAGACPTELVDLFPELGYSREGLAITAPPCPSCGSIFAHEKGGEHVPDAGHIETRETGSSLRIVQRDAVPKEGQPIAFTSGLIFCASGDSACQFTATYVVLLREAFAALEASEFVARLSASTYGVMVPKESEWHFAYRAHDASKQATFSKGSPDDAFRQLGLGAGVGVMCQSARGFSAKDAAERLTLDGWAHRMTDARGNVEGSKSYEEAKALELERLAIAKREKEIEREVAAYRAEIRAQKLHGDKRQK